MLTSLTARCRAASAWCARATLFLAAAAGTLIATPPVVAQGMQAAIGVYRPSISRFFVDGDYDQVADLSVVFGTPGDQPILGDLRGDGTRHPGTFRDGVWKFDRNRDGIADVTVNFGAAGDIPLVHDLNLDGADDLVYFRNGVWYGSMSGTGSLTWEWGFGIAGDTPLIGDVNGDGIPDLVIFRNGVWYVSTKKDGVADIIYTFGMPGDMPLLMDYNGDGRDDLTIYRNGVWFVSTTPGAGIDRLAQVVFQIGIPGDKPLHFGRGTRPNPRQDAARLLYQATFGPTEVEIGRVQSMGAAAWVDDQLNKPVSQFTPMPWWPQGRPNNEANAVCPYPNYLNASYSPAIPCRCINEVGFNRCERDVYTNFRVQTEFFRRAMTGSDQLRLRTAWALSQILVTSNMQDPIAYPMRDYMQMMMDYAFGDFQQLLLRVTASPWMGNYLDMVNNNGSVSALAAGRIPNENYARELLQLFSIGLWELKGDGTLLLDAGGNPIPTYDQDDVMNLARALTGWTYYPRPGENVRWNSPVNYLVNMIPIEGPRNNTGNTNYHDETQKEVMGFTFPAGGRAEAELPMAVALVAQHPNTGPFIVKQLINQLTTGNPTPAYVQRVVNVFNNNGAGKRGDLKAVVRAILLDPEARASRNPVRSKFGKLKEPVLYVTNLLRQLGGFTDGVYVRGQTTAMGQNVFNSPTVFNYYTNEYVIPGTNLFGPPFEIFDATLYFQRARFAYDLIYSGSCDNSLPLSPVACGPNPDTTVAGATGTKIDWTTAKAYAHDPPALVQYVDQLMFYGGMSPVMRANMVKAVSAVNMSATPTQGQRLDRARMAFYLAAISPKFQAEY